MKKVSNKEGFYKYLSIILVIVIVSALVGYFVGLYGKSEYEKGVVDGQNEVLSFVVSTISEKGVVEFKFGENNSLKLVPEEFIEIGRKSGYDLAAKQIIGFIESDGYVRLSNNDTDLILVPYEGEFVVNEAEIGSN